MTKIGELYKEGEWFCVIENVRWYKTDGTYYRENDELTEQEANSAGFFKERESDETN